MELLVAIEQHLCADLVGKLASASAMALPEAEKYQARAVPALVRQLAQPTNTGELNARWDMCRQLYLSQVLTDAGELLRTDLGWPNRRVVLTQKIMGDAQLAALQATTGPAQTLLGYLTILALATIGEQASAQALDPAAMGIWLGRQRVPLLEEVTQVAPMPARPAAVVSSVPASRPKGKLAWAAGIALLASLGGGYWLFGAEAGTSSAEGSPAPAAASVVAPAAGPAVAPHTKTATPAPAPAAAILVATAAKAPAAAKATPAAATKAGLADTIGNAALAQQIGGEFNVSAGRYPKGEGQPLTVKLVESATLTVGINSPESLLYKRLVNSDLPRPAVIALDRLTFGIGQARLEAEGAQQLGNVASLLKTFPKARLLVVGHATTKEPEAIHLGLARATAAVAELVKQGISADRLQAQGALSTSTPPNISAADKQALLQGISLSISRLD